MGYKKDVAVRNFLSGVASFFYFLHFKSLSANPTSKND